MPTVAEIRRKGFTHLRVACTGCNAIRCTPWELMPAVDAIELDDVRRRLRCSSCGTRPAPDTVVPWAQYMASGYQVAFDYRA